MEIDFKCLTDGNGLWSSVSKSVHCTQIEIDCDELCVYFDSSWNVEKYGLIYTDSTFIAELRANLNDFGFSPEAVDSIEYSEQGMQGTNYVSFDTSDLFVAEYENLLIKQAISWPQ